MINTLLQLVSRTKGTPSSGELILTITSFTNLNINNINLSFSCPRQRLRRLHHHITHSLPQQKTKELHHHACLNKGPKNYNTFQRTNVEKVRLETYTWLISTSLMSQYNWGNSLQLLNKTQCKTFLQFLTA